MVVLCHGYGEHCGRYAAVAERLVARGFAVRAMDHVGHGNSDGPRGLVTDFHHLVADFEEFATEVYLSCGPPLFLLGHSMGGAVALHVAVRDPDRWAGVLLSAPLFCLDSGAWKAPLRWLSDKLLPSVLRRTLLCPPWRYFLQFGESCGDHTLAQVLRAAVCMALLVAPETTPTVSIDVAGLCTNPAIGEAYLADPLVNHDPIRLKTLQQLSRLADHSHDPELAARATFPLAIFHGAADPITPIAGTFELFPILASSSKALFVYPGFRHEIFHEDTGRVTDDMVAWMMNQMSSCPPPDL
jgi:alpha-beta hydrolase superfamily lysophospholipase